MCGDKVYEAAADADFSADKAAALSLSGVLIEAMIGRHDRKPRENCNAILPALIAQIERKGVIHARQLRNLSDLVDALSARDAAIDFLQANQIGMLCVDDAGDARSEERRVGKECRSRWSPYH